MGAGRDGMFFTRDHEWVRVAGDEATVGITPYAQETLGAITYVDFPPVGKRVGVGDSLMVIESVKAASDIHVPVSGTVSAVNEALVLHPERINRSPLDEGWLCRLKPFDGANLANMLSEEQYRVSLIEH